MANSKIEAPWHFSMLQEALQHLGMEEAKHKASVHTQVRVWLGLRFDTTNMTITILDDKLGKITKLVANWILKRAANIQEVCTNLGKLFYITQCCPPPPSLC